MVVIQLRRTAGFSISAMASLVSWNTSTRCTWACLLRICCKSPSCVPAGRPRTRIDRFLTSAERFPLVLKEYDQVLLIQLRFKVMFTGSLQLSHVYPRVLLLSCVSSARGYWRTMMPKHLSTSSGTVSVKLVGLSLETSPLVETQRMRNLWSDLYHPAPFVLP